MTRNLVPPFDLSDLQSWEKEHHQTPYYIYDEQGLIQRVGMLNKAFDWHQGYQNFFAVKALPNPAILKILKDHGMGVDCSSMAELCLAERLGFLGKDIMFTSSNTPIEEFAKASELGAVINFDDLSHISFYQNHNLPRPEIGCLRLNPGKEKSGNQIIGNPVFAKFGATRNQIKEGYRQMKAWGIKRFGIHTMSVSSELNIKSHIETAQIMFDLMTEIFEEEGICFEFVNLGGGYGIPYRPHKEPMDLDSLTQEIEKLYRAFSQKVGYSCRIISEHGRFVTGPIGYLVTKVRHLKNTYKKYIGVDACMSNLMRPSLYGSYHSIIALGKENKDLMVADVVGSICENLDKLAIDRELPELEKGDFLVFCDVGAHAHSMGFQYNGRLRSAEYLLKKDKSLKMIRRAETLEDYFATLV